MKLSARDTDAFLQSPHTRSAATLLYGPDAGLVRERVRSLSHAVLGKNSDPLSRTELTHDQVKTDPARLRDELSALSLMGGERLIILNGAADKTAAFIEEAYENCKPTAYLIVVADELSPSSPLRSLFEKEARFVALACYRDDAKALQETIRNQLQASGLTASRDAMQYLAAQLGNDRGVTLREIEKIALYMGQEKEVTLEIAMLLTSGNTADSSEDICHAVALGHIAASETMLAQLLREGAQPVAIIRALLRHFQRLEIALAHMAAGSNAAEAAGLLRPPVFFKYLPSVTRALARWQPRTVAKAQNLLLRAEKDAKSNIISPALLMGHILRDLAQ